MFEVIKGIFAFIEYPLAIFALALFTSVLLGRICNSIIHPLIMKWSDYSYQRERRRYRRVSPIVKKEKT